MNPALRVKHAHQASSHSPLTRRLRQTGSAQPPRVLPCRGARLLAKAMQNHSTHSNSIATGTYSQAPAWPCPRLHAYPRASRRAAVRAAVAPAGGRRSGPAAGGGGGGGRAAEDRGGRSAWKRDEDEWDDGGEAAGQSANARRLKMVVAYDGSEFAGFQFQPGKVRTVQGELERCAKRLFHGCSRMVGASRTDGGAHAYGQVVHFDVYGDRDSLESDVMYYNSFLPPDVRVISLEYAEEGFDSHFSSCGKTYLYRISSGLPDPTQSKYRWWVYDRWCERSRGKPGRLSDVALDVGAMRAAAGLLLGRHDFSAFMDNKRPAGLGSAKRKNPKLAEKGIKPERTSAKNTRILLQLDVTESASPVTGGQEVTLELTGNGFLYRMVRMLAAGLVEVGHGRLSPAGLRELLEAADRSRLPEAAPPHGLYLARVLYRGDPALEQRIEGFLGGAMEGRGEGGDGGKGAGGLRIGEEEVRGIVEEMRQTQGQKAAALMRAAAEERRAKAGAGGEVVGEGGVGEEGAGEVGGGGEGEEEAGGGGVVAVEDYSRLRDREDDQ